MGPIVVHIFEPEATMHPAVPQEPKQKQIRWAGGYSDGLLRVVRPSPKASGLRALRVGEL